MSAETDDLLSLAERCGLPAPAYDKLRALVDSFCDVLALVDDASARVTEARKTQSHWNFQVGRLEEDARAGRLVKVERKMVPVDRPGGVEYVEEITRAPDLETIEGAQKKKRAAEDQVKRQRAIAETRNARYSTDGNVLNSIADYLRSLPSGVKLTPYDASPAKLRAGETSDQALVRVCLSRDKLMGEKARAEAAPLPLAAQRKALAAQVRALADRGQPAVYGLAVGQPDIRCPTVHIQGSVGVKVGGENGIGSAQISVPDSLALIAWIMPDMLTEMLAAQMIGERADPAEALSAEARLAKLAELEAEILAVERTEESLLVQAHERGYDLPRRADATPEVVLEVIAYAKPAAEIAA